jgi:hypothetical protein
MSHNRQTEVEPKWSRTERLAQAFGDPLRLRVLHECVIREISPEAFQREVGTATLARVKRAFELLVQYEWLERTRTDDTDPDAVEHFYRAVDDMIIEEDVWSELPDSMKALITARIVESLVVRTKEAMKAGTIYARDDAHLTWRPLELDGEGWDTLLERLNALFHSLPEEQERARARMEESGEEPIPMTVALMAFESPNSAARGR